MTTEINDVKPLLIRMPRKIWYFLKHDSAEKEQPMNVIIMNCLDQYMKKERSKPKKKLLGS